MPKKRPPRRPTDMNNTHESILGSKPFEFLVGLEQTPCYIYSTHLARFSQPLQTLATVDSKLASAHLPETAAITFLRFVEFAHTGDYSESIPRVCRQKLGVANPATCELIATAHTDLTPDLGQLFKGASSKFRPVFYQVSPQTEAPQIQKENLEYFMRTGNYRHTETSMGVIEQIQPQHMHAAMWTYFQTLAISESNWRIWLNDADETLDFTPIFLSHAKLYVFGKRYSINAPQVIALRKLRCQLSAFKLHPCQINDIVKLLRYTYENTTDSVTHPSNTKVSQGIEPLRDLVIAYVVCHIAVISSNREYVALLEQSGKLGRDIISKVTNFL
ncbi:hypothetical protein LTR84_011475 [Exophiala bonariae]|uniref:BTB domain-containing protein n=1 Tax=Exophiala bonariae TaxID=1690606 RepID=A0AAV9NG45_9EURO|nr:hypothetical protein LTR84_011475 [Exophiala bonariae]